MFLPTLFLLGNSLALAPVPQSPLKLPETDGKTEWYHQRSGRTDLYGDPLPDGARCRIGTNRFRFGDTGLAASFSPDGRTLAIAGHNGIHWFDALTGKALARFTAPKVDAFSQAAFLPTDKYLITQSYAGRILFWKLTLGSSRPLRGPETDKHAHFALSGNGKLLAFIKDKAIRLWDVQQGKEVAQLPRQESAYRLLFSADGRFLASMGGGTVTLWDTASRKVIREIVPPEEAKSLGRRRETMITEFALSADGKILAGFLRPLTGQHVIRVWETPTGKELHDLPVIDRTTRAMALSADGRFLALASQNHLQVWDVRTGQTIWHYPMNGNQFFSVCFSPDGRFVAGGLVAIVKIWETATGRERLPLPDLRKVRYFSLSADGRTVVTSEQLTGGAADAYEAVHDRADIRYWDAASGNRLLAPAGKEKHFPPFLALSRDQRTLLAGKNEEPFQVWEVNSGRKHFQVWEVNSGKKLSQISCARYPVTKVFSDDGKFLALGSLAPGLRDIDSESRLELWDARAGKRLGEFKGHRGFFIDVRFSPDGKILASIDGNSIVHLWETGSQKELHQFKQKPRNYRLEFSRDGRMLAAFGGSPEIEFVEVSSGKRLPKMPPVESNKKKASSINALLFSPDGKRLLTADNDGNVFVWQRETGRLVKEWQADPCGVAGMSLSTDGKVLMTQGPFAALIWDLGNLLQGE